MVMAGGRFLLPRRRLVLAGSTAVVGGVAASLARVAALLATPPQTEGPFYPVELPVDRDADLVRVTGADAQAMGMVTHVMGRVLDRQGRPLPGVLVEIWQCDANGRYRHPLENSARPLDRGFQGYGRALTEAGGGYRFRTIRPVPYPGRTPHVHFKLSGAGGELLTTQMYVAGEPGNGQDFLLNAVRDPERRARLVVDLRPAEAVEPGALAGTFDIVVDAVA
jgi:protocatechuate 3,4-dioxygenase, beta subunit